MHSRIAPAAAALTWKAWSGRDSQLNIWIGMTVNGSVSQVKETNGNWPFTGAVGRNAINASAPIVMIGAVSPMARDRPMIMPVSMPPVEYGNTWCAVTSQWVAPSA